MSVRLTGGASDDPVWMFHAHQQPTALTVGADPSCDWVIRAANVPERALAMAFANGVLQLRSAPGAQVRLNGAPLGQTWERVDGDARIDIGLARLEVARGDSSAPLPASAAIIEAEESGVRRSFVPELSVDRPTRPSLLDRSSRASFIDGPSILGRTPSTSNHLWLYVLTAAAMLAGYAFLLALLDE